jgi:hypothetical protein
MRQCDQQAKRDGKAHEHDDWSVSHHRVAPTTLSRLFAVHQNIETRTFRRKSDFRRDLTRSAIF